MKLSKILLEEYQPTIEELQKNIQKLEDRHEYDVNLYEKQSQGLRSGLFRKMSDVFRLEIDNLEALDNRLTPDQRKILTMFLSNIKKLLSDDKE